MKFLLFLFLPLFASAQVFNSPLNQPLAGYAAGSNATISSSNTILTALQDLQAQISGSGISGKANLSGGNVFTGTQQINSGSFIIGGTTILPSGEWNISAAGGYVDPDVGTTYDLKAGGNVRGIVARGTSYFINQVGIGAQTPVASAKLQVSSTTQGFLPPVLTTTQRNAVSSPAEGLQIFNSTTNTRDYYDGSNWYSVDNPPTTRASNSTTITTTSTSYVLMTGMTITTPPAGTYLAIFSTTIEGGNNNSKGFISIYSGGTIAADSQRTFVSRSQAGVNAAVQVVVNVDTQAEVTVNGSQDIQVYWKGQGGTFTAYNKSLNIIRIR